MEDITLNDLERLKPKGVVLGFLNPAQPEELDLIRPLLLDRAVSDFKNSYSYSNYFLVEPAGPGLTRFVIRIFNYGDIDSDLCYIRFIIWIKPQRVVSKRVKTALAIKGASSDVFEWVFRDAADLGIQSLDDIQNIYAVIADPISDSFEPDLADFIKQAEVNNFRLERNPCRHSRKVASYNLSTFSPQELNTGDLPFVVTNNRIECKARGHIDVILERQHATDNASFGMVVNGQNTMLAEHIQGKLHIVLATPDLVETDLVFLLYNRYTRPSTNDDYCRIPTQGARRDILLEWEDSNGRPDFNDYVIRILHR